MIRPFRDLLLCLLLGASAAPLAAATPELDPVAGDVAAFAAAGGRDGARSLELAARLGHGDKLAQFERDPGKRAELRERLAGLRASLARAGRPAAPDAALAANGTISGRVTDDGAPLAGARVLIFRPNGSYYDLVVSQGDGRYTADLPPDTYVIYVEPPEGDSHLSPQLYAGLSCRINSTSSPADGTRLVLASGGHLIADVELADLGRIEGHVRHRETLAPFEGEATIYAADGSYFDVAPVVAGAYSLGGLPPGQYYVAIPSRGDRVGMIYRDVPCNQDRYSFRLQCPRELGTRVEVALDQVVGGIDFELYRGATLEGHVTEASSGSPAFEASVTTWLPSGERFSFTSSPSRTAASGSKAWPPGRYYLSAADGRLTPNSSSGTTVPGTPTAWPGPGRSTW